MATYLEERVCKRCEINKPISSFVRNKQSKDGYRIVCKECDAPRLRAWRQGRGKEYIKRKARADYVKRTYGLSVQEYAEMLNSCNRKCQICGGDESNSAFGTLYIDHCHQTGEIRGILCSFCNTGLGQFRDNPIFLKKAILYLGVNK